MGKEPFPKVDEWIVFVGRSNVAKSSRSIEQIIKHLELSGLCTHNFETKKTQRACRINAWFASLLGGSVASYCARHQKRGRWLKKLFKASWRLAHPADWDLSRFKGLSNNERATKELRKLLLDWQRQWPSRTVHLLSHSAGGIISSWLESEPNVVSLVCFGYPFKSPHMGEEPYRTKHLQKVSKPFLIIQGASDEYSSAEQARRYKLSKSILVVDIPADHNYDDLPEDVYMNCLQLIRRHIGS